MTNLKYSRRLLAFLLAVTVFAAGTPVLAADLAADTTVDMSQPVSIAEYDAATGYATIEGRLPFAECSITVEVLNSSGSFDSVEGASDISEALENLEYIRQTTTDENGYYKISWKFGQTEQQTYPIRVFCSANGQMYEGYTLKIGEPGLIQADAISHWYENAAGEETLIGASDLVVQAQIAETEGASKEVTLLAAMYDPEDGALRRMEKATAKAYGNGKTTMTVHIPLDAQRYRVKVFVWDDLDGMHPVGENAEFDITALVTPSGEEIYADMLSCLGNDLSAAHPYIFADQATFAGMEERIQTNAVIQDALDGLETSANWWFYQRPAYPEDLDSSTGANNSGYYLLEVARAFAQGMREICILYRIEKDAGNTAAANRWAEAAWQQIRRVCDEELFPDWNPWHFLDTAEMVCGMAVAYDWLHDWLSQEQKDTMAAAVKRNAFEPAMEDYNNTERVRTYRWSLEENANNWNLVCNGGLMTAALAFMDNDITAESAKQILTCGMQNIMYGIDLYGTTGDWVEGPTYWMYASRYLGFYMSSLKVATGGTYGYTDIEGIRNSVYAIMAMQGPDGVFNYGDASDSLQGCGPYWFYREYEDPSIGAFIRQTMMQNVPTGVNNQARSEELLWYDGTLEDYAIEYPLDYFGEATGTSAMRSGSSAEDTYVGVHFGSNSVSHAQLDAGTFILDSQGERFFKDIGKSDVSYDRPATTWLFYHNRAEGHNTLVLNPTDPTVIAMDQTRSANCPLIRYQAGGAENSSFVIGDLTSAYTGAASAQRGVMLRGENRDEVIVRDELRLRSQGEVYWFAHTDAEVARISDDGKTVVLEQNGKYLLAKILSSRGTFETDIPLTNLDEASRQTDEEPVSGRKLAVHFADFYQGDITIGFVPVSSAEADYTFSAVSELELWQ